MRIFDQGVNVPLHGQAALRLDGPLFDADSVWQAMLGWVVQSGRCGRLGMVYGYQCMLRCLRAVRWMQPRWGGTWDPQ